MYCRQCGNEVREWESNKCLKCSTIIGHGNSYCLSCGEKVGITMDMCPRCYTPITTYIPTFWDKIKARFKR